MRDVGVILAVTNRSKKFQAPEFLKPSQKAKTRNALLADFDKARTASIEFMKSTKTDLRGHFMDNPLLGMIDAYQWILFMTGHSERHLLQLKEVKADPNYPKK